MSVPTAANRVFPGVTSVFIVSGVTYTAVSNIELTWGHRIHEEHVTGATNPYLGTGGFHGEVRVEGLGSADNRWEQLADVSSGIVTTFGMTWQGRDQEGIGASGNRTWTLSGKFTEFNIRNERDNLVRINARAILATVPTVVQS